MDSTQFSTDLIKKFQQFFRHMDKACSEFLGVDYQPIPAQKKDQKSHKVKDPNAPKRNLSAFFFFSNLYREKILQRNPDMKIIEIARIAGNKWREMTPEERAPYQQKADEDKARYDLEHAKYQHDHGIPEVETKKKKKQQKADERGFKSGIEGDESESHSQIPNLLLKVQQQKEAKEQKDQKQKDTKDAKEKQQKKKAQSVSHAEPVEDPESPIIVKSQAAKTIKQKGASTTQNQKKFSADQDDIQADIDKFMKNKDSPQKMTIPVKKVKKQ